MVVLFGNSGVVEEGTTVGEMNVYWTPIEGQIMEDVNNSLTELTDMVNACDLPYADLGVVHESTPGDYSACLENYGSYCDSTWQIHILPDSIRTIYRSDEGCTTWDQILVPRERSEAISCFNCTLYETFFFGLEEDYLILHLLPLVDLSETSHLGVGHEANAKCTFRPFGGKWVRE